MTCGRYFLSLHMRKDFSVSYASSAQSTNFEKSYSVVERILQSPFEIIVNFEIFNLQSLKYENRVD